MRHLLLALPVVFAMQFMARADMIAPGTEIAVRSDAPIHVSQWDRGRIYPAHVARDVYARDGDVAIPRGSSAELIVRELNPGQMVLDLESVTVNGQRYVVGDRATGPSFNTSQNNGYNGLVGIIGAIDGAQMNGNEIRVPADALVRFQLQAPLRVADWQDPGYMRNGFHYHRDNDWYR